MSIFFKSYITPPHSYMQHFLDGKTMTTTKLLKYLSSFAWKTGDQIPYFVNQPRPLVDYYGFMGGVSISPYWNEIILLPLGLNRFKRSEVSKHIRIGTELIIPYLTYEKHPDLYITLVYTKHGWRLLRYEDMFRNVGNIPLVKLLSKYINQRSVKFHKEKYDLVVKMKHYKHVECWHPIFEFIFDLQKSTSYPVSI